MSNFYVRPDADQLGALAQLLADGKLSLHVAAVLGVEAAEAALSRVTAGSAHGAVVIRPG